MAVTGGSSKDEGATGEADPVDVAKAEEEAKAAEEEAMKTKVANLADYEWSEDAAPLKDSIYNLLDTLMAVDMKFKEFSSEMSKD
jgi:hypothetical protein